MCILVYCRCLPSAAHKGVQQAPKVVAQSTQQQTHNSTSHSSTGVTATPTKQVPGKAPAPSAAPHRSATKMTDAAAKATHTWSNNSYSSIHQQHQQYHQQAVQQQPAQQQQQFAPQQQQQRYTQRPQPGQAKASFSYKAGSRVFKPTSSDESYIAPAQVAAAAAAATAALAPASVPAAVPTTHPTAHQLGYSRRSSNSSVPDRRSSTGDGQYAPCYKHLGPSNMHSSAAPADTYITCLSSGGSDNGTDAERQQSGTDMLGAITSLLSDLYKMGFSGSSSAASSRPDSRQGGLISRSDSGSKTTPAEEALCNLPI